MSYSSSDIKSIDAATARAWLNDGDEIALLDVREAGQFGEGHPFFAIPLPYSRLEIDTPRLVPRADTRIVLFDDDGTLALKAGQRLIALGYADVSVMDQGAAGWLASGYTLFRGVNVPSKTFGELVEHEYATPHLSAKALAALIADKKPHALLDGRTLDEHRKMTLPGAIPVPNGELAYRAGSLVTDPEQPIIVHCAGRTRSIIGAQTLRNLGIPNPVIALENGTQGWALAGLTLEHGSDRPLPSHGETADVDRARALASALAGRFRIETLDAGHAQAWIDEPQKTVFLIDVRTAEEFAANGLQNVVHAAGGQLIQATDQTLGVRHARVLLVDYDGVRAPVVATWLVQLGFDTALVEPDTAARLTFPNIVAGHFASLPALDASALREASASNEGIHLLDLRSSAAYRREHADRAHWTIRPALAATLASIGASREDTLILFTDERAIAELAAIDLRELGYGKLFVAEDGLTAWRGAGLPVASTPDIPSNTARIDYLFFVHDRHDGNLQAAQQYLDWETGLIADCAPDEIAQFRIGVPA